MPSYLEPYMRCVATRELRKLGFQIYREQQDGNSRFDFIAVKGDKFIGLEAKFKPKHEGENSGLRDIIRQFKKYSESGCFDEFFIVTDSEGLPYFRKWIGKTLPVVHDAEGKYINVKGLSIFDYGIYELTDESSINLAKSSPSLVRTRRLSLKPPEADYQQMLFEYFAEMERTFVIPEGAIPN